MLYFYDIKLRNNIYTAYRDIVTFHCQVQATNRSPSGPNIFEEVNEDETCPGAMANKDYMGRIYMKPLGQSRGQNAELYVNIGWNTSGNQTYPPYDPRLAAACTEAQYNDLINAYRDYIDSNAPPFPAMMCCMICSMAFGIYCCCIPLCCLYAWAKRFTGSLQEVTKKKTDEWSCPVRLALMEMGGHVAQVPDQMAYDQYGQPLLVSGKHGHVNAAWPPLGYNLIIVMPMKAEEFAPQWVPAATAAPTQIGMPQSAHIQQPLPVVQAQVVQAQVVQPVEQA